MRMHSCGYSTTIGVEDLVALEMAAITITISFFYNVMLLLTAAGQSARYYERGSHETTRLLRLKDGQWTEGSRMPLEVSGVTGTMVRGKLKMATILKINDAGIIL